MVVFSRANSKPVCKIDTTAFTSVMVILVFTLVIGEIIQDNHHGMGPDLPRVNNSSEMREMNREDALVVAIARDGRVFFGTNQIEPEQLSGAIRQAIKAGAERKAVYIRADGRTRYANVVAVLDAIQTTGIQDIAFFVDQRKTSAGTHRFQK